MVCWTTLSVSGSHAVSCSVGVRMPMAECGRVVLSQWPHSVVASSTASISCQGPWPKDEFGLVQGVERLGQSIVVRGPLSSPGFCGGWFIWMWWWLVVPGGRRRAPRRLRARRGCACRWRSEGGWCPYQWPHSAVATTGGVDVLPRSLVTEKLGLVQRVECLSQSEAERSLPGNPPRQLPRSRTGQPRSGWTVLHPTVASGAPGQRDQPRCVSAAR